MSSRKDVRLVAGNVSSNEAIRYLESYEATEIEVSQPMHDFCQRHGIVTALTLDSSLIAFPTSFVTVFGWTYEQVAAFHERFRSAMMSVGVEPFDREPSRQRGGMGAMAPPGREWMMGRTVDQIDAIEKEARETGRPSSEVAVEPKWRSQ